MLPAKVLDAGEERGVKISYLCANTYIDPKVTGPASFPTPPVLHDREVGARGVEAALGHARLADELG
jgi:hypothetical protein